MSDDKLDRIEAKIDKIIEVQGEQAVTLAVNTTSLQEHAKRSDTLEDLYHDLDQNRIQPVEASINRITGAWKVFIYVIVPLVAAVIATMHFIK